MNFILTSSLILLATLIIVFLYWLVTKTLKEGNEALEEMGKKNK